MSLIKRAVVAVVLHEERALLGKKNFGDGMMSGKWHIPGETVEFGETDEQALIRGIMEEAGLEVRPDECLVSHTTPKGTTVNWYKCSPLNSPPRDIKAGSDLDEVMWVSFEDVVTSCHEDSVALWPGEILEYFQGVGSSSSTASDG